MEECEECGDCCCWRWEVESYLSGQSAVDTLWTILGHHVSDWLVISWYGPLIGSDRQCTPLWSMGSICATWAILHGLGPEWSLRFCWLGFAFKRTFHRSIFNNLRKNARRGKRNQKLTVIMPQDPDESISLGISYWVSYVSSLLRERLPSSLSRTHLSRDKRDISCHARLSL